MKWVAAADNSGAETCSDGPGAATWDSATRQESCAAVPHPELQRKLKLRQPQALSQRAASTTTCPHCAPGSLLGCRRASPQGPSFWVPARHLFEVQESQPNGCRTQHVAASLRAQLPNVGKLQLELCYPDHLPTNSTITFQAPRATKSHLQPCDHLPPTCGTTSFVNSSLGGSTMSYIHSACRILKIQGLSSIAPRGMCLVLECAKLCVSQGPLQ